jgi:hypothetical protein
VDILGSSRRRRRLLLWTTVVAVAAPLIILGVHYSTPGSAGDATGPNVKDDFYRVPKHVPFTADKRRAVRHVLARFISTAVARKNVEESWPIVGPSLRQGLTRKQWATGNIPVTPYPAASIGQGAWDTVQYSYANQVGLDVIVFPKPGSGYSIATADVDVVKGHDGRWRVDYWMIKKFHGPASAAPADSPSALKEGPPGVTKLGGKKGAKANRVRPRPQPRPAAPAVEPPRPDRSWLALPIALLSLAILLPIVIGTIVWIRNRRAAAAYYRSR